jgi:hypothetical protein
LVPSNGRIPPGEIERRTRRIYDQVWRRGALAVLGDAQRNAPIEEGTLRASGRIDEDRTPAGGARFTVVFSTPYAAAQERGYAVMPTTVQVGTHMRRHPRSGTVHRVSGHVRHPPGVLVFRRHPSGGGSRYVGTALKTHAPTIQRQAATAVRRAWELRLGLR